MARRYRNGWWLEVKYWNEELTQREIGKLCDVSARTIRKQMKRFGIPTRDMAGEDQSVVRPGAQRGSEGEDFSDNGGAIVFGRNTRTDRRSAAGQRTTDRRPTKNLAFVTGTLPIEGDTSEDKSFDRRRTESELERWIQQTVRYRNGRRRANRCGNATACANTMATTVRSERSMFTTSFQSDCSGRWRESHSKPLTTNETSFFSASDVTAGLNTVISTCNRTAVSLGGMSGEQIQLERHRLNASVNDSAY
jgi:hypothetical protein